MITDRLRRAIRLLMLLRQSDGLSLREIARWLDCSQRTVYRDLQLLKGSGFEVIWSAKGYEIEGTDDLPRAALEQEELLALVATISASPLINDAGTRGHLQRALQKLIAVCSPETRTRWLHLTRCLSSGTGISNLIQRPTKTLERMSGGMERPLSVRRGTATTRTTVNQQP